jgi:hypothetical protein
MIAPSNAPATVRPSMKSVSASCFVSQSVAPETTAASKPNSRPPKAATIVAPNNARFLVVFLSLGLCSVLFRF